MSSQANKSHNTTNQLSSSLNGLAHDSSQPHEAQQLVANDLDAVHGIMESNLQSEVPLIQEVVGHIVHSGGKRLRPTVLLLAANALGCEDQSYHRAAAVVEFIHTATLIHDDVVDASMLRRGQATTNQKWGNEVSVLVGDFIYSRTFQLITAIKHFKVMELLAHSTGLMAEGEVKQLMNRTDPNISMDQYLEVITYKTAKLFEVATSLPAVLAGSSQPILQALEQYGLNFGIAFQLIDDVLDYSGDVNLIGKKLGDDLAEGKPTLPLIYAMQYSSSEHKGWLKQAVQQGECHDLPALLQLVRESQAIDYTVNLAASYAQKAKAALTILPESAYREGLVELAEFAVRRCY